jgi:hypothetical protein
MNPFDLPPSGAPFSVDAPEPTPDSGPDRPRRGRTALVAVLTLGLVGGGVAGVSQFASADRPDLAVAAQDEPTDDTVAPADDEATDEAATDESTDDGTPQDEAEPTRDGEIVIDTGDGAPVVIDLGDLDVGRAGELAECIGLPSFDADGRFGEFTPGDWAPGERPLDLEELLADLPFDLDALEELERDWATEIGDIGDLAGGSVTVVGPDGVSVVDLGENGSVTVTTDDGELTVSTEGDATVSELDDLFGEFGSIFERGSAGLDDELFHDLLDDELFHDLPGFESIDPDAVQSCIDEVLAD